jgi:hypothetical protein
MQGFSGLFVCSEDGGVYHEMDRYFAFWTSLLTILFTMEALEMLQGGIHGKAVMVGKGMTIYTFKCAVTGMT